MKRAITVSSCHNRVVCVDMVTDGLNGNETRQVKESQLASNGHGFNLDDVSQYPGQISGFDSVGMRGLEVGASQSPNV